MLRKAFKLVYSLAMFGLAFIVLKFSSLVRLIGGKRKEQNEQLWLIAEQAHMARDNGIAFYDYCMDKQDACRGGQFAKQRPNVKAFYVIDKKSSDYDSIKNKDNVVQFYSFRHFLLYLKADALIMCFPDGICPSVKVERILRKIHVVKNKKIYLKHGIIKDDLPMLHANVFDVDLIVAAAKREYEFIRDEFGHRDGVVKLLGLSRYDYLKNRHDGKKYKILLMPTWRRWIGGNLRDTEYYKKYAELIAELTEVFQGRPVEVQFFLHNNFQKYADVFSDTDVVKILHAKDYKVNKLINSCDFMITDYSSVAFDFAYLEKPLAYYQFDYDELRARHYPVGYFDYEKDGFGPVFFDASELVRYVDDIYSGGGLAEDRYRKRIDSFFEYHDINNRQRTYEAILKLVREQEAEC